MAVLHGEHLVTRTFIILDRDWRAVSLTFRQEKLELSRCLLLVCLTSVYVCRIIHQSWRDENVPKEYSAWQQSWIDLHPDWKYNLWTDEMNLK